MSEPCTLVSTYLYWIQLVKRKQFLAIWRTPVLQTEVVKNHFWQCCWYILYMCIPSLHLYALSIGWYWHLMYKLRRLVHQFHRNHQSIGPVRLITTSDLMWTAVQYRNAVQKTSYAYVTSLTTTIYWNEMLRYDKIPDAILTCCQKLTWVILIYRTEPTTKKVENRKTKK